MLKYTQEFLTLLMFFSLFQTLFYISHFIWDLARVVGAAIVRENYKCPVSFMLFKIPFYFTLTMALLYVLLRFF